MAMRNGLKATCAGDTDSEYTRTCLVSRHSPLCLANYSRVCDTTFSGVIPIPFIADLKFFFYFREMGREKGREEH